MITTTDILLGALRSTILYMPIAAGMILLSAGWCYWRKRDLGHLGRYLFLCLALLAVWTVLGPRIDPLIERAQDALSKAPKPPKVRTVFDV